MSADAKAQALQKVESPQAPIALGSNVAEYLQSERLQEL